MNSKFKAAVIKVTIFISNVCKETKFSDIIVFVKKNAEKGSD